MTHSQYFCSDSSQTVQEFWICPFRQLQHSKQQLMIFGAYLTCVCLRNAKSSLSRHPRLNQ